MPAFVGRAHDLDKLQSHLRAVRRGHGRMLSVRGRRQAGKSRLITEFVQRSGLPHLFTTGSRQPSPADDLERFTQDVALSCTLPGKDLLTSGGWSNWEQALRVVGAALPADGQAIVVIDEFPWLLETDPGLDGTLQKLWDTVFENRAVLFVLVGSDLSIMEGLTEYGRPLYGRAKEFVVTPFDVGDTAQMLGLEERPADAFDAYLATGGYPRLLAEWRGRASLRRFLVGQLSDDNSDLAVVGQRMLDAEFPKDSQAADVLRVIGSGERSFRNIAQQAGIPSQSLIRALDVLRKKHVVEVDQPTSTKPANEPRYRVADPYLRFWLRFVEPSLPDISRGRPDLAEQRLADGWESYRGRAIEPVVREAMIRLKVHGSGFVGGWWPRTNNPEVDVVGVDRPDRPRRVTLVGSIKWREKAPFDERDLAELRNRQRAVPGGASAPLLAVSRSGCTVDDVECLTPDRLLEAWA